MMSHLSLTSDLVEGSDMGPSDGSGMAATHTS
jgi:hypothetical protein